jgi:hypothetical protein
VIEMRDGLDAGEWARVQKHGCGRREGARRKVVLGVGRGWATPSPPLSGSTCSQLGTLAHYLARTAPLPWFINTARSPTMRPTVGTCPLMSYGPVLRAP